MAKKKEPASITVWHIIYIGGSLDGRKENRPIVGERTTCPAILDGPLADDFYEERWEHHYVCDTNKVVAIYTGVWEVE